MLQGIQKSLLKGIDPKTLLYIIHIYMYLRCSPHCKPAVILPWIHRH